MRQIRSRGQIAAAVVALSALTELSATMPARADVVEPPPPDCPPGSVARTDHGGPWCEATTCESDGECAPQTGGPTGLVCREVPLCVQSVSHERRGMRDPGDTAPPAQVSVGVALCGADGSCAADAHCVTVKRCVAPSAFASLPPPATGSGGQEQQAGTSPTSHGCASCSVTRTTASGLPGVAAPGLVTLALAGGVAGRRRRRSRAGRRARGRRRP